MIAVARGDSCPRYTFVKVSPTSPFNVDSTASNIEDTSIVNRIPKAINVVSDLIVYVLMFDLTDSSFYLAELNLNAVTGSQTI